MTEAPASFTGLAREQLPWLFSLARRLVGADRAEDVVQDCLLRAYRRFDTLRDHQAAPAWFRQILVNCARDAHRRAGRRPREEPIEELDGYSLYRTIAVEDPLPYSESVHLDFLAAFTDEDVWAVLDRLQPQWRMPLVLVHMEGFPTKQVARMLGVPLGTVLSWLHRGRKAFEKQMWQYAEERDLLATRQEALR